MPTHTLDLPALPPRAHGQRLRDWMARWAAQRRLACAERALAEMSLHALRDIGAPEPLLQRRQRQDEQQRQELRAWTHLRG
jgi:uncharacterized protein YjiS (DUF1127 family)